MCAMTRAPVEVIEELWAAFGRGGIAAMLELVDEEVDWMPSAAGGRVLRGHDELLAWARSLQPGERILNAHVYALEQRGESVLVAGHLRIERGSEVVARQMHWLYTFSGGRLRRAEAFATREEALAARDGARV